LGLAILVLAEDWVITSRVKRIASGYSTDAFPESDRERESSQAFQCISRAGRLKAATRRGSEQIFFERREKTIDMHDNYDGKRDNCVGNVEE